MKNLIRSFRKYHRILALIASLPLILTVLTGVGFTIMEEWFEQKEVGEFLLELHTLELLHLEKIFPILNGLGLIGLLVTGISMTSLFRQRPQPQLPTDKK